MGVGGATVGRVLILSSFVASSGVGGFAQSLVLSALGHEPVLAPTVLFGRHPGLGPPGGAAVAADVFEGVLEGVERQAAGRLVRARELEAKGFTPEAIETNPIVYDMVMYVKKPTDESILISRVQGERVARHGGHPECV